MPALPSSIVERRTASPERSAYISGEDSPVRPRFYYVRRFRLITVLAMLISLPFAGIASSLAPFACPVSMEIAAAGHDCCPDEAGQHAPAKRHAAGQTDCGHCDAASSCKTPQSLQAQLVPSFDGHIARHVTSGTLETLVCVFHIDTPLRPPQA